MNKRYVDVDDVLDLFGVEDEDLYATGTIEDALYDRTLKVYKLPSAERRGRWKPFDLTWGRSIYACTACGEAFEVPTECGKPMYEFCPHCGALMDKDKE